jgi:hypothetical protein
MTPLATDTLSKCLELATDTALRAGALIRAEFHRPGGPRGGGAGTRPSTTRPRR